MEEEIKKINTAVDSFATAIKARMLEKYQQGYHGWDGQCSEASLVLELYRDSCELLLRNNLIKFAIDIGARAMMLWYRHNNTLHPEADAESDEEARERHWLESDPRLDGETI